MQQEISCMIFSVGSYGFQIPVAELLKKNHDYPLASHGGTHKTLERLRRYYYWPGLVNDVKSYTQSSETCKSTKAPNRTQRPPMGVAPVSEWFFQRLYIDFLDPYPRSRSGNIGIFIVLDHYSKRRGLTDRSLRRLGLMWDLLRKIGTNSSAVFAALSVQQSIQHLVLVRIIWHLAKTSSPQNPRHWCFQKRTPLDSPE